ncbi:ribosome recycling factor [Spiroplasma endosymbiont of Labia minor]|uniref:ribosome recycling factor n=1 Tax=Spiroplasma endosymbiont of Labia minor TaxID=3066305 RepID=UPI0030D16925
MTDKILEISELKMKNTIESWQQQLKKIRTGRANPSMLDSIKIDYYGDMTPLNQIAQVNTPEPQQLIIKPYDRSTLGVIQGTLSKSGLNLNSQVEADLIRIKIPPLTEDIRKDLVKNMLKNLESFKVQIRNERRDALDNIKKTDGVSEDSVKIFEKQIQNLTDQYINELEVLTKSKEAEIMKI